MIVFSVVIAIHGYLFQFRITGAPDFHARFDEHAVGATMHVLGGATVLLLGGFQFWGGLRQRWPALHRNLGRVYLVLIGVGGLGGLMLAPYSAGGLVAHFGFGILGVLWLYSGWQAYAAIRRGDVAVHREWMMRNFAMTFGAVTLRIYLGILIALGVPFEEAYPTVAWISWVPNLILVEWYLALSRQRRAGGVRTALASQADCVILPDTIHTGGEKDG